MINSTHILAIMGAVFNLYYNNKTNSNYNKLMSSQKVNNRKRR